MELVWALAASPSIKLTLAVLMAHVNRDSGDAFPSYERMAGRTGLSRPTLQRILAALHQAGLVSRRKIPYHATRYHVILPALEQVIANDQRLTLTRSPRAGRKAAPYRLTMSARTGSPRATNVLNGSSANRIAGILACHLCGKAPSISDSPGSLCFRCTARERKALRGTHA